MEKRLIPKVSTKSPQKTLKKHDMTQDFKHFVGKLQHFNTFSWTKKLHNISCKNHFQVLLLPTKNAKWFGIFHPKLVVVVIFSIPKLLQPPRGTTLGRRTPTCNAAPCAFRWSTSTSGRAAGDVEVEVGSEGAVIVKGSCARWSGCGEECLSAGTWLCHFGKIRHGSKSKKNSTQTCRHRELGGNLVLLKINISFHLSISVTHVLALVTSVLALRAGTCFNAFLICFL